MTTSASHEHHTAVLNGIKQHWVQAGSGPAVLLLHGWPQTSYEWRKVMDLLSDDFTVIAPDIRGQGFTAKPASGYDAADDLRGPRRARRPPRPVERHRGRPRLGRGVRLRLRRHPPRDRDVPRHRRDGAAGPRPDGGCDGARAAGQLPVAHGLPVRARPARAAHRRQGAGLPAVVLRALRLRPHGDRAGRPRRLRGRHHPGRLAAGRPRHVPGLLHHGRAGRRAGQDAARDPGTGLRRRVVPGSAHPDVGPGRSPQGQRVASSSAAATGPTRSVPSSSPT